MGHRADGERSAIQLPRRGEDGSGPAVTPFAKLNGPMRCPMPLALRHASPECSVRASGRTIELLAYRWRLTHSVLALPPPYFWANPMGRDFTEFQWKVSIFPQNIAGDLWS